MKVQHFDNDGRARFVTFSTHDRLPVLSSNQYREIVIEEIVSVSRRYHLRLLAFVIMPEHVHLVVVPPETCMLGKVIGELKRKSAMRILEILRSKESALLAKLAVTLKNGKRVVLWLPRCYDHNCRTEKSVWEKVRYVHENPVKRGLVTKPEAWKWSSARYYKNSKTLCEIDLTSLEVTS